MGAAHSNCQADVLRRARIVAIGSAAREITLEEVLANVKDVGLSSQM
jgi:hypothetical protein